MIHRLNLIVLITFTSLVTFSMAFAQSEAKRHITKISGDLYRFQNNFHFSVFLVTKEGVIATDPINADAAKWLKQEINNQFDQPVKYLIYSHHHADHVSGGEVFAEDDATVIAHENAPAALKKDNVPTAMPSITFSEKMILELGGKKVELTYLGRNHSDNSIVAFSQMKKPYLLSILYLPSVCLTKPYHAATSQIFLKLLTALLKWISRYSRLVMEFSAANKMPSITVNI